eukprot:TRINITY_DN9188_c0_g2_i5.p1 TRINITY_DN9188_c0_g2~~TRINITY_DN9188_c0_g2_i5.p1  ORF type:complete len:290 (-),score=69.06 TRINITY_DN9188_c0_g2_i5:228-1097(-)
MDQRMRDLFETLADRERVKLKEKLAARDRIRKAELAVTRESEALLEMKRAQEQELRVRKAKGEKLLRDTASEYQAKVRKAKQESAYQLGLADISEQQRACVEDHLRQLTARYDELRAQVILVREGNDARLNSLGCLMEARIEQVNGQADRRVTDMASHEKSVSVAADDALEVVSSELQQQAARANLRAEGRTRFRELCELSRKVGQHDCSKDTYYNMKDELIGLWHCQAGRRFILPMDKHLPPVAGEDRVAEILGRKTGQQNLFVNSSAPGSPRGTPRSGARARFNATA